MGTTAKYGIYYDDATMPAKGRLQDETQAKSIEVALSTVENRLTTSVDSRLGDMAAVVTSLASRINLGGGGGGEGGGSSLHIYDAISDVGCVADAGLNTTVDGAYTRVPTNGTPIAYGTDNTERINAFLSLMEQQGGGILYFPPGKYLVSGIIVGKYTTIMGAGEATEFILKDGSNRSVISNRVSTGSTDNAFPVVIRDLKINGNRWGQAQTWGSKKPYDLAEPDVLQSHGVLLHRKPRTDGVVEALDSYSLVENVAVEYTQASGIQLHQHGGENRIINCHVFRTGGYGIVPAQDSFTYGCTAGETEFDGFMIARGSSTVAACKAFRAGVIVGKGVVEGNAYPARATVAGFAVVGSGHATLSACNAQNNAGSGFRVHNASGSTIQGLSDCNNMLATTDDAGWFYVGIEYQSLAAQNAALGSNLPAYQVKPWTADGIEFTGKSWRNVVQLTSWVSTPQGGTPNGYNRHAVSFGDDCQENHLIITSSTAWEEKTRLPGEIVNPVRTSAAARLKNFIQDGLGRPLGYAPDASPVVDAAGRAVYAVHGQKIIDSASGALLWFDGSRSAWRKASDGSVV